MAGIAASNHPTLSVPTMYGRTNMDAKSVQNRNDYNTNFENTRAQLTRERDPLGLKAKLGTAADPVTDQDVEDRINGKTLLNGEDRTLLGGSGSTL